MMTNEQIERLYMFLTFNPDVLATEPLMMILETDLSKDPKNN